MNPPNHDRAIRAVREAFAELRGVRAVVLFGSAARGTATEESDIDLLIECDSATEDVARRVLYDLADRFRVAFSPAFYRAGERDRFDTQFLESILRHGRPLRGEMPDLGVRELDLQPLRLVSYQTPGLDARTRARLLRAIDGYRTRKRVGRKRYAVEKRGFLGEVGGWRVGRGAVVIPEEAAVAFDALLQKYGATRSMIPVWCQRP